VTTAGKLTKPSDARVSGAVSELALLQPIAERRWSVQFPATNSATSSWHPVPCATLLKARTGMCW